MSQNSRHAGFTLVETLVVISVIAIVAAITTPILVAVKRQAKVTSSITAMRQWYIAVQLYRADENTSLANSYGEASAMGLPTASAILSGKTALTKDLMRSPCAPQLTSGSMHEFSLGYVYFPMDTQAWGDYCRKAEEATVLVADTECHLNSAVTAFTTQRAIGLRLNGSIKVESGRGNPIDVNWWNR